MPGLYAISSNHLMDLLTACSVTCYYRWGCIQDHVWWRVNRWLRRNNCACPASYDSVNHWFPLHRPRIPISHRCWPTANQGLEVPKSLPWGSFLPKHWQSPVMKGHSQWLKRQSADGFQVGDLLRAKAFSRWKQTIWGSLWSIFSDQLIFRSRKDMKFIHPLERIAVRERTDLLQSAGLGKSQESPEGLLESREEVRVEEHSRLHSQKTL